MIFQDKINVYHKNLINNKQYFLIYFIIAFVSVLFSGICINGHYKFTAVIIIFSIILGFLCLLYYFNHKNELHKVAFVTIISFGVICAFITPIFISFGIFFSSIPFAFLISFNCSVKSSNSGISSSSLFF